MCKQSSETKFGNFECQISWIYTRLGNRASRNYEYFANLSLFVEYLRALFLGLLYLRYKRDVRMNDIKMIQRVKFQRGEHAANKIFFFFTLGQDERQIVSNYSGLTQANGLLFRYLFRA